MDDHLGLTSSELTSTSKDFTQSSILGSFLKAEVNLVSSYSANGAARVSDHLFGAQSLLPYFKGNPGLELLSICTFPQQKSLPTRLMTQKRIQRPNIKRRGSFPNPFSWSSQRTSTGNG